MILIKPHHFIDIIKLYGSGIEEFVPEQRCHHSFNKVANQIINDKNTKLKFTVDGDDICSTCIYINEKNLCTDGLSAVDGYTSKDEYNKRLDEKLISQLGLSLTEEYTARQYCKMAYEQENIIFRVWDIEKNEITQRRNKLFRAGCKKYLEG